MSPIMTWFGVHGHSLFMRNKGTKINYTSMANEVHFIGTNKMGIIASMRVFAFIFSGIVL